jgi:integrase
MAWCALQHFNVTRNPNALWVAQQLRLCRWRHRRHRFAVQTLVRWYHGGEEVERRLPILSTYLGHAHVTDTYWYLTNTPELRGAAGKRLDQRWGGRS